MEVRSETKATVINTEVERGQAVAEGDVIVILESMKMEIPVHAPISGIIKEIRIRPEATVEEGEVLVVIDPSP
jgi:urea carboxylase